MFAWEGAPEVEMDKERSQEHINGEILDNSEPRTSMEVTDRGR